jgi:RNA polymerase sigma-70 factor (ECF subfamily)
MNTSPPAVLHRNPRSHGRRASSPSQRAGLARPMSPGRPAIEHERGSVPEVDTASFQSIRPRLFGIAYRVLGNPADADDVVQDTWIRWQGTDRTKVRDPAAFLATTTTRLAINHTQSARARRVTYIGPWLPEPADAEADPTLPAEQREALELAVLTLLEKLTPTERAAYVLREAFDYPYRQISKVLELGEANARQLVRRARDDLSNERRNPVSAADQERLIEAFVAAAETGDLAMLEQVLAADVVTYADGGAAIRASRIHEPRPAREAQFRADIAA